MKTKTMSHRKLLAIAGTGWLFDAMDVGLLSFVMAALQKDWGLSAQTLGWIGAVNALGMAVGAFLFGVMADRIGRKHVFMATLLLFSIASGLTALAETLCVFLILRFLIGMGLGGELPVASTLVAESVPASMRGRMIVLLESFWAWGWLLAALIAWFVIPTYGWRVAMVLGALPALYAIYLRFGMPDSPRFNPALKMTLRQTLAVLWSPEYRRSTLMLWIVWFGVVFSYYGMFLWLPGVMGMKGFSLVKSFEYVLIMTLAQLPGYFTAAWLIERMGRKFVLGAYLLGTAISAALFGVAESATHLVISGMMLSFFNLGAWGALYAYTPEQYPDAVRAAGSGTAAAVGRIGGLFGPLIVGYMVGIDAGFGVIFGMFCASILLAVVALALLGRETRKSELLRI